MKEITITVRLDVQGSDVNVEVDRSVEGQHVVFDTTKAIDDPSQVVGTFATEAEATACLVGLEHLLQRADVRSRRFQIESPGD